MNAKIGMMQGRLSPPIEGKLQAFPVHSWEEEFPLARACGFDAIEWIFQADGFSENPIWTQEGVEKIRQLSQEYRIEIPSVCADYFMPHKLFRVSPQEKITSIRTLRQLIRQAASLGVRRILLPVLEDAEIQTEADQRELVAGLRECFPVASEFKIELAIESNLEVGRYRSLIETLDHPLAKIYYDIGNRAAMGYEIGQEVRALGPWISGVHVKDRRRGGPSVPLGKGDVDFPACFEALYEVGFKGSFILQAARDGEEVQTAKRYLAFVKSHLEKGRYEYQH